MAIYTESIGIVYMFFFFISKSIFDGRLNNMLNFYY